MFDAAGVQVRARSATTASESPSATDPPPAQCCPRFETASVSGAVRARKEDADRAGGDGTPPVRTRAPHSERGSTPRPTWGRRARSGKLVRACRCRASGEAFVSPRPRRTVARVLCEVPVSTFTRARAVQSRSSPVVGAKSNHPAGASSDPHQNANARASCPPCTANESAWYTDVMARAAEQEVGSCATA